MPITDIKEGGGMPFIRYSIQEKRWYLSTEDKDMKEIKMTSPVVIAVSYTHLTLPTICSV